MVQLIPLIIILPLLAFYLWMFRDMAENDNLPSNSSPPLTWPPTSKYGWTVAFIFLNVFAALMYYSLEYRKNH